MDIVPDSDECGLDHLHPAVRRRYKIVDPLSIIGSHSLANCPSNEAQAATPKMSINSEVDDGKTDILNVGQGNGQAARPSSAATSRIP